MYARNWKWICPVILAILSGLLPAGMTAQGPNGQPSRWDIFAGYSYLSPHGTVNVPNADGTFSSYSYDAVNLGGLFSGAYYLNKFVGVQGEYAEHEWGVSSGYPNNIGTHGNDDGFQTFALGPIVRFPQDHYTLFLHALFGGAVVNGPFFNPNKLGPDITVGGGLDYDLPWMNHRFAIRIFQADYEYMHADFGTQVNPPGPPGGRANVDAARLSTGFVIHAGSIAPPPPVTLACAASPQTVFPGEPVTVTATAGGLNPKDHVIYGWSGPGVTGSNTTATVTTASLAPGQYTVQCNVKEGKPGKEGLKPWETANSSTSFTVKDFEPPTISCSASPSTINPGDSATITSVGTSPQNRPLTYSYTASAGSVTGSGTTATYSSAGAQPGAANVTCGVSDDKGHSASSATSVTVVAPPPPPPAPTPEQVRLEARLALHSVFFPTAQPRAEHPEGGLVASQQGTLSTLATDFKSYLALKPDAHLTLTGHTDVRGSAEYNQALSDRRVNRVKQFLVAQGLPESSIDTRAVGKEQELSADQVKALVNENSELSDADKAKVLKRLNVIVLAQNRRVDISLSTTGQQSEQLYPFNAADSKTLLDEKATAPSKNAAPKKP